jgi:hypothetical protein
MSPEGARRLVEAAEHALELLARRDQLAAVEERDVSTEGMPDRDVDVDVDECNCDDDEQ